MSVLSVLAGQAVSTPAEGWGELLATYGPFAPFAALLLWLLRMLWQDNKEKEAEIKRLTETAMERIIPLVLEATKVLAEAVETLKGVKDKQNDVIRMNLLMEELSTAIEELQTEMRTLRRSLTSQKRTPRKQA